MNQPVEFRNIREFGDIISDTFVFIKQNFKSLLKTFVVFCGFFALAGMASTIFTQLELKDVTGNFYDGDYQTQSDRWTWAFYQRYTVIILFGLLNFAALYVSVLSYVSLYVKKGNVAPTLEEVWGYFKYYFFRVLFSNIGIMIFTILAFCCCIIPGIYVFPVMSLFFPVMVLENTAFRYAFNRSFNLIRNEWWITAVTILIIYFITYLFSLVFQAPAIVITVIGALTHQEKALTQIYTVLTAVFQYIAQVFYVIPLVASALIYFNLVERKESTGLMERINAFGQHKEQFNTEEEY